METNAAVCVLSVWWLQGRKAEADKSVPAFRLLQTGNGIACKRCRFKTYYLYLNAGLR